MRRFSTALAAASIIAFMQFASAADLPVKAPPVKAPAAVYYDPWTGFYAGVNIGYSWGHTRSDYRVVDPATGLFQANTDSINMNGVIGGGQIGYNYRFNQNWLAGFETDFQGSGEKGSNFLQTCVNGFTGGNGTCDTTNLFESYTEKLEWFGTVRGRVGYLPDPRWLVYATGGFAYGKLQRSDTLITTDTILGFFGPPVTVSYSKVEPGWTVGAGVEAQAWQNWTWKLEYLYMRLNGLGSNSVFLGFTNPPLIQTVTSHAFTDNIVRFGLNYRFAYP
jgi:outer membrane immunogenic protein